MFRNMIHLQPLAENKRKRQGIANPNILVYDFVIVCVHASADVFEHANLPEVLMAQQTRFIGVDIGRSGIKIAIKEDDNFSDLPIIPAIAIPADSLAEIDETTQEVGKVTVGDMIWLYGRTAVEQGSGEPAVYAQWEKSQEYEAIVAGVSQVLHELYPGDKLIVVSGLPAESSVTSRQDVAEMFKRHLKAEIVKVWPQPLGALWAAAHDRPDLLEDDTRTAVLDVGRYSTDLALVTGTTPNAQAYRSTGGVRVAVEKLSQLLRARFDQAIPFERLEESLYKGGILRFDGESHDVKAECKVALQMLDQVITAGVGSLKTQARGMVDYVVLAGGGAQFADIPKALTPAGGRHAVARGFAYIAEGLV
jgi:hypothetical protein